MDTRLRAASAAAISLLFATACATSGPATSAPTSAPAGTAPASAAVPSAGQACATEATEGDEVLIANFEFTPGSLTVPVGTAVAWTNTDSDAHTVTFDGGPDCGRMEQDATVALDFDTAGTFTYFCAFHLDMRGEVIVE